MENVEKKLLSFLRVCTQCKCHIHLKHFEPLNLRTPERSKICKMCSGENRIWRSKQRKELKLAWLKTIEGQQYIQMRCKEYWKRASIKRRHALMNASPAWANYNAIESIYEECARISFMNEVPHEVDHIIPLQGKNVCGLHIAENLQIITKTVNRQKSNRFFA